MSNLCRDCELVVLDSTRNDSTISPLDNHSTSNSKPIASPQETSSETQQRFQVSNDSSESFQNCMDLSTLSKSYHEMRSTGSESKVLTDMYGMLLSIVANQDYVYSLKDEIKNHEARLSALESKVGGQEEISERLGLAIRNLPLPPEGMSELSNVGDISNYIQAPGVNTECDVIKAIRFGNVGTNLGTVKVELRDENCRSAIMKNKKSV